MRSPVYQRLICPRSHGSRWREGRMRPSVQPSPKPLSTLHHIKGDTCIHQGWYLYPWQLLKMILGDAHINILVAPFILTCMKKYNQKIQSLILLNFFSFRWNIGTILNNYFHAFLFLKNKGKNIWFLTSRIICFDIHSVCMCHGGLSKSFSFFSLSLIFTKNLRRRVGWYYYPHVADEKK